MNFKGTTPEDTHLSVSANFSIKIKMAIKACTELVECIKNTISRAQ